MTRPMVLWYNTLSFLSQLYFHTPTFDVEPENSVSLWRTRNTKKGNVKSLPFSFGLSEKIWTSGLLNPIQARYQTALHPDIPHLLKDYIIFFKKSKPFSICFLKKLYFFWKSNLRIVFCSSIFTLNRSETTLIIVNIYLNKNFWILRRFCVRKALKVRRAVLSVRK